MKKKRYLFEDVIIFQDHDLKVYFEINLAKPYDPIKIEGIEMYHESQEVFLISEFAFTGIEPFDQIKKIIELDYSLMN